MARETGDLCVAIPVQTRGERERESERLMSESGEEKAVECDSG